MATLVVTGYTLVIIFTNALSMVLVSTPYISSITEYYHYTGDRVYLDELPILMIDLIHGDFISYVDIDQDNYRKYIHVDIV